MKRILFTGAVIALLANAYADNKAQPAGLYFGGGFVVNCDQNKADVDTVDTMFRYGKIYYVRVTPTLQTGVNNNILTVDGVKTLMNEIASVQINPTDSDFKKDIIIDGHTVFRNGQRITANLSNSNYGSYLVRSHFLKRRITNYGAEVRVMYFHPLNGNIVLAVDLCSPFNSRTRRSIHVTKAQNTGSEVVFKLEQVATGGNRTIATSDSNRNVTLDPGASLVNGSTLVQRPSAEDGINSQLEYNRMLVAKNGGKILGGDGASIWTFNDITELDKYADVGDQLEFSFKKGACSPKLCMTLGTNVLGYFAGVRAGFQYMRGNLTCARNGTQVASESASLVTPVVGVQLMKQTRMLNNNAHLYLIADFGLCDSKKNINRAGIRNYKMNGTSISVGVVVHCNPGF